MARFELSELEFVRACLQLALRRPKQLIALAFVGCAILVSWQVMNGHRWHLTLVLCVLGTALLGAVMYSLTVSRLRDAYREQESLRLPIDVTIDDAGLTYASPDGEVIVHWSDLAGWKETDESFLLFERDMFARILPKRALSEAEFALLRRQTQALTKS
jgi:hypothetical protein